MNFRQAKLPSRRVKTGNDLGKKLAGYSAMAGAALAVGAGWADAAPQYTAGGQTLGPGQSFQVDLDGGGSADFILSLQSNASFGTSGGFTNRYAKIQGVTVFVSAGSAIKNFPLNAPILNGAGTVSGSLGNYHRTFSGTYAGSQGFFTTWSTVNAGGNFRNQRGFIGVRFQDDALFLQHSGWIDVELNSNLTQMIIHGWAWETDIGTEILAGDQGPAAVPLPGSGSLAALALGAAGLLRWRNGRKNSEKDGRAK